MTEIRSSLGKTTFNSSQRKVLTVPNDGFDDKNVDFLTPQPQSFQAPQPVVQQAPRQLSQEEMTELQTLRQQARILDKKPTLESKKRINLLCDIERAETSVTVGDYKFTLRSLKTKEMREIMKITSQFTVYSEAIFEMRNAILAKALYLINDSPVNLVIGSDEPQDILDFISEMQESVNDKLYNAFKEMTQTKDIKDVKDAQEVAEEIKK